MLLPELAISLSIFKLYRMILSLWKSGSVEKRLQAPGKRRRDAQGGPRASHTLGPRPCLELYHPVDH